MVDAAPFAAITLNTMTRCRFYVVGRRCGLLLAGICLLFVGVANAQQPGTNLPPSPRKPCIVLIVASDLGYGDLGCYGQTRIKTPNIDKLAAEGMRFTSFYAGSSVSVPSRAALMTGKHTGHSSIRGEGGMILLQAGDVTMAQILQKAGFRTAALGVWGLGDVSSSVPSSKGFEEWFGYLNDAEAQNHYPQYLSRSGEGYDRLVETKGKYSDDYFTESALNFLNYGKPEPYNHYRPFFLYLPYTIARANTQVGQATGNGMEVPSDAPYSGEQWPAPEKNKAAMITRLDGYVGQLMDKLAQSKNDKNTIVIFTSANGPHKEGGVDPRFFNSAGPLRGLKRDLYEGGIRVPLIVRWPLQVGAGATSDLPCASWDFLPTAAEIAKTPPPKDIDGISLLPTLLGQVQTNRHEFLYWELHDHGFKQAVRMGDWKAVRSGTDGPLELYNLKTDLGEKNNVVDKNPEVVAKIEDYLKNARTDDKNWPARTTGQTVSSGN